MRNKICFIAPSGYGKSTAIGILKESFNLANIKIATPLYHLQNYFYDFIGTKMNGEQDGELLQYLGVKIRRENPEFLLEVFKNSLNQAIDYEIITNDDCRPPDYNCLKNLGFIFIGIIGFNRDRIDHTKANPKSPVEWQSDIVCDYWVNNMGSMEEYRTNLNKIMKEIIEKEDK